MNEEKIMEYWESQPRRGHVDDQLQVCLYGEAETPECGDSVALDILPNGSVIVAAKHTGKGCVLSQAGASMLTEYLVGKSVEDAARLTYEDMLAMFGGRPLPVRMGCCLLPLRALQNALQNHH
jgi:NifU-like protein involved in Fe-S cluster formation